MGYRDDTTALESHCSTLEQERGRLREELSALESERVKLEREVRDRRWRLRAHRLLAWCGRHKGLVFFLLAAILIPSFLAFRDHARNYWLERQRDEALQRAGCFGWLQVSSTPAGATVLVDGQAIGATPLRERVCPGGHLVRATLARHFPWQQLLQMPGRGELGLRAQLHPMLAENRPAGGTLILSTPPGASVFVDGAEIGRTPVFLPDPIRLTAGPVAVALAGYLPVRARPRPSAAMWFTLRPSRSDDARTPP